MSVKDLMERIIKMAWSQYDVVGPEMIDDEATTEDVDKAFTMLENLVKVYDPKPQEQKIITIVSHLDEWDLGDISFLLDEVKSKDFLTACIEDEAGDLVLIVHTGNNIPTLKELNEYLN